MNLDVWQFPWCDIKKYTSNIKYLPDIIIDIHAVI